MDDPGADAVEREVTRLAAEVARELRPAAGGAGAVGSSGAARQVAADASLERDLGLDSLGRAELVARLERSFGVRLPEQVLANAETLADLARAVAAAKRSAGGPAVLPAIQGPVTVGDSRDGGEGDGGDEGGHDGARSFGLGGAAAETGVEGPAEAAPDRTRTLIEVLEWHAERHPRRRHLLFYEGDEEAQPLTYGDLLRRARRVASGLRSAGVERRQAVALMLPSGHDYFAAFCGVLAAGGVPVPLYPPARRSQIEDHLRRQAGILATSQAVLLVTFPEVMTAARLLRAQVEGLGRVVTVADLEAGGDTAGGTDAEAGAAAAAGGPAADDLALLQFTSGSTGRPKGVMLTHANLLANLRAIGRAVDIGPEDVVVSWLPLYHDMGLIGAWMASLYFGMPLILMSPLAFLARPARWLQALSRHRGTLSAAPNFAYELCAAKIRDDEIEGVDLSAWRFALNGAEPVSPEAIRRFTERFRSHGFRSESMAPVYGLAECSLALAFPPLGRGPRIDGVEREAFVRSGRAVAVAEREAPGSAAGRAEPSAPLPGAAGRGTAGPEVVEPQAAGRGNTGPGTSTPAAPEQATAGRSLSAARPGSVLRFVACGVPLPGHELRIVDAAGHEVGDRQEGRLQFRGPSATAGYFRDPEATRRLRQGDWLESGDRAYTVGREVFLTGRDKDIIIRAGRNLYPHELEEGVGEVPGIRKGCVAVFGVADRDAGTERLVVVAETRERSAAARETLRAAVQQTALALLGEPVDEIVLVPPHSVPKTSSGKIRRSSSRELYLAGRLGRGAGSLGLQLAHLALSGARVQLGRAARAAWAPLYSIYVWAIFLLVGLPLWIAVAVLPGHRRDRCDRRHRRHRRLARAAARLMFRCTGLPLRVAGSENLAVVVAVRAPAPGARAPGPCEPAAGSSIASSSGAKPGCLIAVNHASYLDGVALTALLPPDFAFVAKRELDDSFFSRVMMRRLGTFLVERFDRVQSAAEADRAAAVLAAGESLIIFPEGTFRRAPGLRPFRLGAFLSAVQAGAPIVPAVLHGTRQVLRDGAAIFRRGPIDLEILPAIAPDGDDWPAALRLRDRVRAAILARYDEPDLAGAAGGD
jgi:acyl carrier protein